MCLIIHNPKAKVIPVDVFDTAAFSNPDGFGIFYHDTGEIITTMDYRKLEDLMYCERPFTCHFRYATSGVVDTDSCHPFDINDRYSLMMNGTIDRLVSKSKVDTEALCEILADMNYKQMTNVLSTHSCRFAILDKSNGRVTIINRDLWTMKDDVLYSKATAFYSKPVYKQPAPYKGTSGGYGPMIYDPYDQPSKYRPASPCEANEIDDAEMDWQEWLARNGYINEDDALRDLRDGVIEYPNAYVEEEEDEEDEWELPADVVELEGESDDTTRIAVYGTLKEGRGNHGLLKGCELLGHGTTRDAYPLLTESCPYLIDEQGVGHNVVVEVYRVDAIALRDIDRLEGHPNWYVRRVKPIIMDETGDELECYIYVIPKEKSKALVGIADESRYVKCY